MPVTITATRSTSLFTDQDGDGRVDQGDTLFVRLDIANSGDTDALNVVINDALLGQSLVAGSLNISPVAFNDSFNAVGNTQLLVGGATGLSGPSATFAGNILSNDLGALAGDNFTGFTLTTTGNIATTGGGSVVLAANGSFSYNPAVGFEGADTFTYTIRDAGQDGVAGNSDDLSSTAKVTINVGGANGQVWYVDSSVGAGGDGTSDNPFNTITAAGTASGANDYIYVKGAVTGNLTMDAGGHLIGTGSALTVGGYTLATAGANSDLTGSSGFTLTLGNTNEIAGIDINSTGGAANGGITGTSFGTLTVNNATIDASGQALILNTGAFAGGGFTTTNSAATSGGTAANVFLTSVTGTVNLGGGALAGSGQWAVQLQGGNGSFDYNGTINHSGAGAAITVNNKTGGTVDFDGAVTTSGNSQGVSIGNSTGATINFDGGLFINTSATNATGFSVSSGGTINVTGATNTISSGQGTAVNIANAIIGTGGVAFLSVNSSGGSGTGIILDNAGTGIFRVTGTGTTDGSGGTIANKTGANGAETTGTGIYINNTANVWLVNLNVTGNQNYGIRAENVANGKLHISDSFFNNNGTESNGATRESSIRIDQVTGAIDILDNDIGGGFMHNVLIDNQSGTANINFLRNYVHNTNGSFGDDGLQIEAETTAIMFINVANNRFQAHGGDHFNMSLINNADVDLTFTGNDLDGGHATGLGQGIFVLGATFNGDFKYNISNNGTIADPIDGNKQGAAIFVNKGSGTGVFNGTISNNVIGDPAIALSGSEQAQGIHVSARGAGGSHTSLITNNRVHQWNDRGIVLEAGEGAPTLNVTVTNNLLSAFGSAVNSLHGIHGDFGILGADNAVIRIDVQDNLISAAGNEAQGGVDFRMRVAANNDVFIAGYSGGNSSANAQAFIDAENPDGTSFSVSQASGGTYNNLAAGGVPAPLAPTLPPAPVAFSPFQLVPEGEAGSANLLPVIDVTTLDRAELALIAATAIELWARAGASGEQLAAMRDVTVTLDDLPGWLASYRTTGDVIIDYNAGGFGWSADDLLAVVMQELGIQADVALAAQTALPLMLAPGDGAAPSSRLHASGIGSDGRSDTVRLGFWAAPEDDVLNYPSRSASSSFAHKNPGFVQPVTGAPTDAGMPVVDDGILTQAEINWLVEAAIKRWAEAGASEEQLAAMRATKVTAADLGGLSLGKSSPGTITLDDNAAGQNWYLDTTPGADEEYSLVSGMLRAGDTTVAGTRVDLLTTLMHELGHQIGLGDGYDASGAADLMYGFVNPGIRRLPSHGDADAAEGAPVFGAFALGAVTLGTLGAGVNASLSWRTTYDGVTNQVITNVANNSVVSGSNFVSVNSTTNTLGPATAPPVDVLTLGDRVFFDANRNGVFDAGDSGINGVALSLFADANNDNIADGAAIATTTTVGAGAAAGTYSFTNLAAGNYIVRVDAGNFTVGPLVGRVSTINAGDPDIGDPDADNDSNGGVITGGVVNSQAITLAFDTEPTGGAGNDTNNTLDFGFIAPNQAPTSGNLSGDIATYTEQQALAALLDVGSNAGVADADSANFDGGTLTVAITGGLVAAQDQLVIRLTGTVSFNATAVFVNGTQIATYTGAGAGGGPLVFTFDPDATPAAVAELVRAIAYTNSGGDNPTAGPRTITWTLVDGDGTFGGGVDTLTFSSSVNVVAVDDTGVAGADSGALSDNATTIISVLANDNDPDGPPLAVAQVNGTAIAIGGSVTLASGAKVIRNADGTLTYDTNGAFEALPTAGSGASNPISATDSFTYTLAGGGTATVTMTINGIDNNDTLTGTGGDDILFGGVGNDIINALGGNDRLYGGTGADTLTGGGGDDIYIVDNAGDVIVEGAGGGLDTVFTSIARTLGTEQERIGVADFGTTYAIDLTGNGVANEMWGNDGANVLDGAGGADIMSGFGGDDTYRVDNAGDVVIESLNQGTDTVTTTVSYTIAHDIEKLLVADAASVTAINLTGNDSANEITGNAGANVIDGGLGADTMTGLGGNDLYIVDNAGDVIVEAAGGGLDTVFTSVTRTLGAELERIGVNGFATTFAIDLTGNSVANEMWGNDGANTLDGAGGADIMRGFAGDDTYRVDDAGDVVIELLNQGTDTVLTTVSYTIAHDIEKLLVSDAASVTALGLTGNEIANEITGNAGANVIDGGLGADTMTGLGGNDLYYVDNAGDVIVEASGGGLDTVFTSVSFTLGNEVDRLGVNGFGTTFAIDLTGNGLDNEMWGNAGANVLDGKAGSDIIYGFAGADTFAFTTALGASNIDQLVDFTAAIDKIALDDAIFTGLATGTLAAAAFRTGSAAADADDRIVYDNLTGALYFDADGDGAGAQVQFATLHEGLSLTASDFQVI